MNEIISSQTDPNAGTQFTINLGQIELSDEEVNTIQNQITRIAIECIQGKGSSVAEKPKEPFVRIIFVRSIPNPR